MRIARFRGDVPQSVNFALKAEVARTFLDSKGITYQTARSEQQLSPADVVRHCAAIHCLHRMRTSRFSIRRTIEQVIADLETTKRAAVHRGGGPIE
jgi:hypothetical protein